MSIEAISYGQLDSFGRKIERPADDWGRRWPVPATVRDRGDISNVLGDVTPAKLKSIFADADGGNLGPQIELADKIIERDPHVKSLYTTRRLAVLGLPRIVVAGDETPGAIAAKDEFERQWKRMPQNKLMTILLRALSHQWAAAQVFWDTKAKPWEPIAVREVDCRHLEWPMVDPNGSEENQDASAGIGADIPFLRTAKNEIVQLIAGSFVVHTHDVRDGRPGLDAPIRAIAMWWMFKRMAAIDFATFVEQFGKPYRVVKYSSSMTEAKVLDLVQRLKTASSDLCLAIPKEAEHELVNVATSGTTLPQDRFIRICDDQIAELIIGSTEVANVTANADSTGVATKAAVRIDIRDGDANALDAALNAGLIVPWMAFNQPPGVAAPRIESVLAEKTGPEKRGPIYVIARDLGLTVKAAQMYGDLGIEQPEGVPEVIELKPAMLPGIWGPGDGGNGGAGKKRDLPPDDADDAKGGKKVEEPMVTQ